MSFYQQDKWKVTVRVIFYYTGIFKKFNNKLTNF